MLACDYSDVLQPTNPSPTTFLEIPTPAKTTTSKIKISVHKAKAPDAGYWAEIADMPGCVTEGETPKELHRNLREAALGWLLAQDSVAITDSF